MPDLPQWRKAKASEPNGGCVDVARDGEWVVLRDTKDPGGPVLRFNRVEWDAFLAGVRAGEFDYAPLAMAPA